DTEYYGFANQVYLASWQFQAYRANPFSFNFRAGVTRNIQYHPNASCGTKSVYIQNAATAALYNYTPYTPNQAALDAGWDTGNACSSNGNRNFFTYYATWFGTQAAGDDAPLELLNGDFESGTLNPWIPASNAVTAEAVFAHEDSPAASGLRVLSMSSTSSPGIVRQDVIGSTQVGDTVTATAWVRSGTAGVPVRASLGVSGI